MTGDFTVNMGREVSRPPGKRARGEGAGKAGALYGRIVCLAYLFVVILIRWSVLIGRVMWVRSLFEPRQAEKNLA